MDKKEISLLYIVFEKLINKYIIKDIVKIIIMHTKENISNYDFVLLSILIQFDSWLNKMSQSISILKNQQCNMFN